MNRQSLDPVVWQHVAPFLDRALDLPPDERAAWFASLAETDAPVAALVRELLADYEDLTSTVFLETSPASALRATTMSGKRVGAYTVEHLLGRGGMGEVWLASRHDGRFEGHCAIKVLDESLARASLADRFRREAHLLARLVHPHIARLIDAGTTEDGRQYLALEYIDGERIDHYCRSKWLTVEARVRLFLDVIAAVAHAHANLIIHRDLKPSNVLVTRDGVAKLLDFGIAKLIRAETRENDPSATRVEEIALTPDYAAPEQVLGDAPSTATDVYQLGMLLYVLLTGRHPLPATTSRSELAKAALGDELPLASTLVDEPLRKSLRGDLDAILSVALRKTPAERYPTAAALGDDLRRYLNGESVSARHGGALYHTRKFYRRHRVVVLVMLAAAGSLCATAIFALEQAREAARQRDQARIEAKRADAQNRFMSLSMTAIDAGKPLTSVQILENAEKLLDTHYGDDPAFVVDMLVELASHYADIGDRERESAAFTKAEGIARKNNNPLALARVLCNRVDSDTNMGRPEEAAAHLAEGQAALARASDRTFRDEVDCMDSQAALSDVRGQPTEAIRILERALAMLEQREPEQDHDSTYTLLVSHLSVLYAQVGDTRKELESLHKHRLAEERTYGTETRGLLTALHNEACTLRNVGEIQAAFATETQVIQRERDSKSSASNWQTGFSVYGSVYGGLLVRLDRPQAALPWLTQAIQSAAGARDTFVEASARIWYATALLALHRDAEAEVALDTADGLVGQDPQGMRYEAAQAAVLRAQLFVARGNLNGARAQIEPVLVAIHAQGAGLHKQANNALLTASRIAAAQGRLAEAEAYAREALRIDESRARDPALSADVGEATLALAQIRQQLDDQVGARTLARRAAVSLESGLGADHPLTRSALAMAREPGAR